ncbi:MAG: hypothetical protein QXI86_02620 [Ignisphaera sp.]
MDIATSTKGVLEILDDADRLVPVVEKFAYRCRDIMCKKRQNVYREYTYKLYLYIIDHRNLWEMC